MSSRLQQNCVQDVGDLTLNVILLALKWLSRCSNVTFHLGDTTF